MIGHRALAGAAAAVAIAVYVAAAAGVWTDLNNSLGVGLVTVYGTVAQQSYNGDGHANIDPLSGANHARSVTLGTINDATSPTDFTHFRPGYATFITNVGGVTTIAGAVRPRMRSAHRTAFH